jgi:hypothetical protein
MIYSSLYAYHCISNALLNGVIDDKNLDFNINNNP